MDFLSKLNPEQLKAIKTNGPTMIIAGPGTGKTKTLVTKIAFLILEKKINPENILAMTFTKKAANEIKERIIDLVPIMGTKSPQPFIGTFHSLGYHIISTIGSRHGVSLRDGDIRLISDEDRNAALRKIRKDFDLKNYSLRDLSLAISLAKNNFDDEKSAQFEKIIDSYNCFLAERHSLDYDDLLSRSLEFLKIDENARKELADRFQYILIDEFQDTSKIQYELIKLLCGKAKPSEVSEGLALGSGTDANITVIGDPLQAIYSFRGATQQSFIDFKRDFPSAGEITLKNNYRSANPIIEISHQLFPDSEKLEAQNKCSSEIELLTTFNEYSEADWIIRKIGKKMGGLGLFEASQNQDEEDGKTRFSDFAVIYRTHGMARILKQKFKESDLPFQAIGDPGIYEVPEIKTIVAILKYIHDKNSIDISEIGKAAKIPSLAILLEPIFENKKKKLADLVDEILEKTGLNNIIQDKPQRLSSLNEFYNVLISFSNEEQPLKKFVSYIENLKENEFLDHKADKVTLLTMHAAKGLEFKNVFLCGFEDGIIPYIHKDKIENIDEEKRLLYVALTRAKENIYIINAKNRSGAGQAQISRFKKEIESDFLIEKEDEALARILKKMKIKKDKERQMSLF